MRNRIMEQFKNKIKLDKNSIHEEVAKYIRTNEENTEKRKKLHVKIAYRIECGKEESQNL